MLRDKLIGDPPEVDCAGSEGHVTYALLLVVFRLVTTNLLVFRNKVLCIFTSTIDSKDSLILHNTLVHCVLYMCRTSRE